MSNDATHKGLLIISSFAGLGLIFLDFRGTIDLGKWRLAPFIILLVTTGIIGVRRAPKKQ